MQAGDLRQYLDRSIAETQNKALGSNAANIFGTTLAASGALTGLAALISTLKRSRQKNRDSFPRRGSEGLPKYPASTLSVQVPTYRFRGMPLPDEEETKKAFVPESAYRMVGMRPPTNRAYELPLYAASAAGGLLGGYKLVDHLVDKLRQKALKSKIRHATDDYHKTLLTMYDRPEKQKKPKQASFRSNMRQAMVSEKNAADSTQAFQFGENQSTLGKKLDQLYDICFRGTPDGVKEAQAGTMDQLLGVLGLSALMTGVPAALIGHHFGKKMSPGNAFEKAKKEWITHRRRQRRPEVFATPVYLDEERETMPTQGQ